MIQEAGNDRPGAYEIRRIHGPLSTGSARTRPWPWSGISNCSNGWTTWGTMKPGSVSITAPAGRPSPPPRCSWPPPPNAPVICAWGPCDQPSVPPSLHGLPTAWCCWTTSPGGASCWVLAPGALASDAYMFGIDPARQREMMDESLGVIKRLMDSPRTLHLHVGLVRTPRRSSPNCGLISNLSHW